MTTIEQKLESLATAVEYLFQREKKILRKKKRKPQRMRFFAYLDEKEGNIIKALLHKLMIDTRLSWGISDVGRGIVGEYLRENSIEKVANDLALRKKDYLLRGTEQLRESMDGQYV